MLCCTGGNVMTNQPATKGHASRNTGRDHPNPKPQTLNPESPPKLAAAVIYRFRIQEESPLVLEPVKQACSVTLMLLEHLGPKI